MSYALLRMACVLKIIKVQPNIRIQVLESGPALNKGKASEQLLHVTWPRSQSDSNFLALTWVRWAAALLPAYLPSQNISDVGALNPAQQNGRSYSSSIDKFEDLSGQAVVRLDLRTSAINEKKEQRGVFQMIDYFEHQTFRAHTALSREERRGEERMRATLPRARQSSSKEKIFQAAVTGYWSNDPLTLRWSGDR